MGRRGRWLVRVFGTCALWALGGSANAETVSVKDTALLEARARLSHYDLRPGGTAAQLVQLGRYARAHAGQSEGDEAKFLQAAVASDLWFIAELTGDAPLKAEVVESFGVAEGELLENVARALREVAHGVYQQAAEQALAALHGSSDAADHAPRDTRSDTLLLMAASRALEGEAPLTRLSALAADPCAAGSCAPPYVDLDLRARRALAYLTVVGEADRRLQLLAQEGDPLAEALAPTLDALRRGLWAARVQLTPSIAPELAASSPARDAPLPQLDALFLMRGLEVRHATLPVAQLGEQGVSGESGAATLPQSEPLVTLRDHVPYARPIDELVGHARRLRAGDAQWSVGVLVAPGTPTLLWTRVLVSLVKAGASRVFVLGRTPDASLVPVPVHLIQTGYAEAVPSTELKLRVRLGGYTLKLPGVTDDIPRFQDETGYHFDQAALHRKLAAQRLRTAAVSYMGDVAVEQLIWALSCVPPLPQPVELIIQ